MTEIDPEKRLIGYARVSTYGQTLDAQLEQLRATGCSSRNIYREKVTGARADRRELLRMLDRLTPGDVVTVTRIDRLARSTFDLFAIVKRIVDAGGQFRSLAEPWADTATTSPPANIELQGGVRLSCGQTLAGLLPPLECRTNVVFGRPRDDNFAVPL
jgi:DNA invertase Pin-like site-specific DNA recombinase